MPAGVTFVQKFSTDDAKSEWDAKAIYPQSADEDLHDIYLGQRRSKPLGVTFVQGDVLPDPADETKSIHKPDTEPDVQMSDWRLSQKNRGVRFVQELPVIPDP